MIKTAFESCLEGYVKKGDKEEFSIGVRENL
jgi:hypothetical protein